ncbi:hypothetical protein TVAG_209380 [Trichomonas vaginalis G3]|uniref:DNA-directed DNA polymerase n=1 Tax=Trichomonas vaginalis (strain ATCC PRA-98 / G3) TaxID=412133 RepID=A2G2X4_TRIV3|nr:organellar and viral DNA polymerase type B [Trichomonas vaginalis G3]EAX88487.1 hypothetical protein TVAG_209380 [Trichomonas vaginalis G3]KAI5551129.1 organellar and viral DNA polymerase type B [Trichomonas vaginalis G3]|eukprot:XP_001301417.1 hypothetical protein [Trichomonas vaginalis G3]
MKTLNSFIGSMKAQDFKDALNFFTIRFNPRSSITDLKKAHKRSLYNACMQNNIRTVEDFTSRVQTVNQHLDSLMNMDSQPGRTRRSEESRDHVQALMNMAPQPGRQQSNHETRHTIWQMLNISPLYSDPVEPAIDENNLAKVQVENAYRTIASINGKRAEGEVWLSPNVKANNRYMRFDIQDYDAEGKDYFNRMFPKVMTEFIKQIDAFKQNWTFYYDMSSRTNILRHLNVNTMGSLVHQLLNESPIDEVRALAATVLESNYDFFLCNIPELRKIEIFDYTMFQNIPVMKIRNGNVQDEIQLTEMEKKILKAAKKGGAGDLAMEYFKQMRDQLTKKNRTNRSRNAQLWTWTLKLPINLERYQIFNELNARTAKLMMNDCCFIYACIEAGVDENTIDHMREMIRVKDFPMMKIKVIAKETGIKFHVIKYNPDYSNYSYTFEPDGEPRMTIELLLMNDHYMLNEKVPISTMFIKDYDNICQVCKDWSLEKKMLINRKYETRYAINSKLVTPISKILELRFKHNYFEPIRTGELCTYFTTLYKEKLGEMIDLNYTPKYCTRVKKDWSATTKKDMKFPREHVFFADFEASTDGDIHKAYNICYMEDDDDSYTSIWGDNCAQKFLEALPDKSLVYFHNLSYDITFLMSRLEEVTGTPIIKGSQTMQIQGKYHGKLLCFKDSYAIITTKLENFPEMFKLESGEKEVFPYNYYTEDLVKTTRIGNIDDAMNHVKDIEAFYQNIEKIEGCKIDDEHFDMEVYSSFYCGQDVRILRDGFLKFRNDVMKEFEIDAYDYVSMSSISNKLFEMRVYWKNGNLFDLAGKPREYISKCIQGGRCMLANNEKHFTDFDAVSLYPSAIARLYCLEGIPEVMTEEMKSSEYLLEHLFDDDQAEPTKEKFISGFYYQIEILSIGKKSAFPLIVVNPDINPDLNVARSSNTCCKMFVDHITLQDLINFQEITCKVIDGYYYDGKRT